MRSRIALLLAAIAVALLPLTPAQAAYGPPSPIVLQVNASDGTQLARVEGTVAFDDGNTRYTYSLVLCRRSSFQAPYVRIYVNGVVHDTLFWNPSTTVPWCFYSGFASPHSAEVTYGAVVQNVRFELVGSSFPNNVYKEHRSGFTYDNPYN
ncbi:hypothetical protein Nocox_24295 [Nonomuraea coxensis DSM 45129]|uniref:Uncharacterized protein n=1 Tax=Nonomuraea coxensis DSM 45129 TaxID=1122611 RepID=A0ABX8U729_9ACTN|nr:hypothetical protein [Nonomuraea coxensis]QYC42462.1 hypothetical protein Nocox_24295 [Nonomuraea coxensis DSM 45129]